MSTSFTQGQRFALVVDDEPLILMEAVSILEDAGFQMLETAHADQALRVSEPADERTEHGIL